MTLSEYCDAINVQIEIIRYPNQKERWSAKFYHCDVMDDGMLCGTYGDGTNALTALRDYLKQIEGKRIALDAGSKERREFLVPVGITL